MESRYWKLMEEEEACERLELFSLDRKRRWKAMPMGSLHEAPTFVAMKTKPQKEWDKLAQKRGLNILHKKLLLMMC